MLMLSSLHGRQNVFAARGVDRDKVERNDVISDGSGTAVALYNNQVECFIKTT